MLKKLSFETPNFFFEVYGEDETVLRSMLSKAWLKHAKLTQAEAGYLEEFYEDIVLMPISLNTVYRDSSPLLSLNELDTTS